MVDSSSLDALLRNIGTAVVIAAIFGGILCTLVGLRLMLSYVRTMRQPIVSLQLIPPARLFLPSSATEELFKALHDLLKPMTRYERFIDFRARASLEIISDRPNGIRYILTVPDNVAPAIEQLIAGYLPETKIERFDVVAVITKPKALFQQFKQKLHYAYPLQSSDNLHEHDPISYLTNSMTKLNDTEIIAMQLVVRPVERSDVSKFSKKIRRNEDILSSLNGHSNASSWFLSRLSDVTSGLLDSVTGMFHGTIDSTQSARNDVTARKVIDPSSKPVRYLSSFEYDLVSTIDHKLSQPLFTAELRTIASKQTKQKAINQNKAVLSAIKLTSVSKYQTLVSKRPICPVSKYLLKRRTDLRLLKTRPSLILSTTEIATLYHFPTSANTHTDNLVKSLSKTLPAPLSLKNGTKLDIILGENHHHGIVTPIGLTAGERERHIYIVGGTGNGKTTMLLYGIVQDIKAGKGLAVLDPHGDLAESILNYIPEARIKDVIYLNPDDLDRPIGINLLELKLGLTGNDLLREKDLVTESVISVLRKIFSEDDSGGHRIEYVLRNTVQTALNIEGSTLFTIFRLLNNAKYRKSIVRNLEDEDLKNFWNNELGKAGDFQKVKMSAGITAKIGRFLFSATARKVLEQEKSSIDFEEILSSNKILICNFSKGKIGEDTSTLFGTTVLAKLQVAALRRARLPQLERTPYHLYVDEFQNFATMSFVQMLSEARKYKLYLTMAEQSTAQQEEQRLVDIILANVGTVISFRTGSPADELRLLPLFKPLISENELSNQPAYNFYARINAIHPQEPMSGRTLLLSEDIYMNKAKVIELSRLAYGMEIVKKGPEGNVKSAPIRLPQKHNAKNHTSLIEPI